MTATTHASFNDKTEGTEVAQAFPGAIKGKSILITGVNRGGIGFTTAEAFASQSPAHLILASRNLSKLQECVDALCTQFPNVNYRLLKLNLSSQQAVKDAAAEVLSWSDVPVIDIIVNNAGVMYLPERTLSEDGIEMHFATNHIGHFLFTCSLMPKLLKAAESDPIKGATRIVNITSLSPTLARMRWSDVNFEKKNKDLPEEEQPLYDMHKAWGMTGDMKEKAYLPLQGYDQSKVANALFGIAANKRLYSKYGILSLAVHPGVLQTELSRYMEQETLDAVKDMKEKGYYSFKTLREGAATTMVAALDPKLGLCETRDGKENYGSFLIDCQISDKANATSASSEEAERLWALSEQLVREKFDW